MKNETYVKDETHVTDISATPETAVAENPLATEKTGKLIAKFAIPAVASGVVSALYNIVDQIFIGNSVGLLGNGATNVAFPITTICLSLLLLISIGSAANFSLELGKKNQKRAMEICGNGLILLGLAGIVLMVGILAFLQPLLNLFGATADNLPYALAYTRITAIGIPFLVFGMGASHLIRADGSPKYAMISITVGAVLNCILDPIFIFGFDMGMEGAALATIIGQIVSAILVFCYFFRFKTQALAKEHFRLKGKHVVQIAALGAAACINQLALLAMQIVLNNSLRHYGALSGYGSDIPLACVGIISKIFSIFISIYIGISQGCQPIFGFNYGAKNYARVKETYKKAYLIELAVSVVAFVIFQLFPRFVIGIFGNGTEEYFQFGIRYLRIFMMLIIISGIQPLTSNFFSSIGKARLGIFVSLTRNVLFLIPLVLIFPLWWGIDGIMYAGPVSDGAAFLLAMVFVIREMKKMEKQQ